MNIFLLGAPGSGKGTQAELLVDNNNFIQLSTGDLFRQNIANNTVLGIEAKKYMNEGNLVPDDITNKMVWEYLNEKTSDNLIFDGYPRTIDQATKLDTMLKKLNHEIDFAFYIKVDEDILIDRISNRWICPTCKRSYNTITRIPKVEGICDYDATRLVRRPDDEPAKVKIRLDAYKKETAPLINFYQQQQKLIEIDGQNSNPSQIYQTINEYLNGNN